MFIKLKFRDIASNLIQPDTDSNTGHLTFSVATLVAVFSRMDKELILCHENTYSLPWKHFENSCLIGPAPWSDALLFRHAVCAFYVNHMQGKITKMWLANEEGIFS